MYLIEILLPLYDNAGHAHPSAVFRETEDELVERFGGVTAFLRAPAQGKWRTEEGHVARDEIVICEVMAKNIDRSWWRDYRARLAQRFGQAELVVRATEFERL